MKNTHRLPIHVKPERYEIMLKPDLGNFTFSGEETIFLILEKPTKQITLHCVDIEIDSAGWIHQGKETWARSPSLPARDARVAGGRAGVSGRAGKISYQPKSETATFTFPKIIQKGTGKLKIIFRGILNDKMRGFYRSKFTHQGKIKHLATTQFESTDARRAFPSFDEPHQKAVFDVTLMIPAHLTAISNTIESEVLEHESGYKLVKFVPTPKMSSYLLAFIVGEFEYIESKTSDGILVRVFTTPGKKQQAKFALEVGKKCLEFYNNYFGISYPLPVLDMIAIPDFAAGAMENWGAVTYRESTLLIDEERSSTGNKQWVALVIAHELAHMWFGDLVTMKWWTHLWLNEGFASFIEYLAIDHMFPTWDIWIQFVQTEMNTAYSLDALENTHPIEVEVGHPAEISEIFDTVSYSKGASILRMLHEYLGAEDFQKGLQHYLKKHAYSNAETEDLWKSLQQVSGKPVLKVMKNWTSKAGHPLITIREKGQAGRGKLELTQSRFFSSPISKKISKDKTIWSIPLTSLRATKGSAAISSNNKIASSKTPRNDDVLLMSKKSITISKPKNDEWIKLNVGESSFVRVDYPHHLLKGLEEAVRGKQLSPQDRLGLIRDSFDLAQSGNSPTTLALELALSYKNEQDFTVWSALTSHLLQIDSLLALEPGYENFRKYGREVYCEIAKTVGWKVKTGEKHTTGLLRGMVLYRLGSYGDAQTILKALKIFKKYKEDGIKIEPDLKGVVYNLVAENGGIVEYETLVKMYKDEDNQQEKDRLGRSLGSFKSIEILQKALDFALSENVRFQNSLGIIASVWGNANGRYLAWEFVKKNWKLLKERYAGGHYFTRVFGPAGEFTRLEDAKDIKDFVKRNPVPEAKRTIAQALEQIYSNADWLKRDGKGIKKFLGEFRI